MEEVRKLLFDIRSALEMMDFVAEPGKNEPYKIKLWMYELKQAVIQLDELSKTFHWQYDILELQKMSREERDEIADHYKIDKIQPKQTIIYEILDKQTK